MSREQFDDNCPGCRPIIFDPLTGKELPDHSPEMCAVLKVWKGTTLPQRQAWHRITCQNSRSHVDLELVTPFINAMREALRQVANSLPIDPENN